MGSRTSKQPLCATSISSAKAAGCENMQQPETGCQDGRKALHEVCPLFDARTVEGRAGGGASQATSHGSSLYVEAAGITWWHKVHQNAEQGPVKGGPTHPGSLPDK